ASYPSLRPKNFALVDFDSPSHERTLKIEYEDSLLPLEATLLSRPSDTSVGLYLATVELKSQSLKEISVSSGSVRDGDWTDYRYSRSWGPVGGIQPFKDNSVELFPYADGQLVFRKGERSIESDIRLPAGFRYREDDDMIWAFVLTPEAVVLVSKATSTVMERSV